MKPASLALLGSTFVLAPLAVYSLHGCSGGEPDASPEDASPETGRIPIDAPSGADVVREDGDEQPSGPTWAPEGWTSLQTLPGCGFIVPQSKETLPPPLRWEDCPTDVLPASGANGTISRCRMLAPSWPSTDSRVSYPAAELSQRPGLPPVLAIMRATKDRQFFAVADVDGTVHTALAETSGRCFGNRPRARGEHFTFDLISRVNQPRVDGAVGGRIGDLTPRVLNKTPAREGTVTYPGPPGVATLDTGFRITLVNWDTLEPTSVWNPLDDDGLQAGELAFVGDDLLFSASGSLVYHKIKVHVPGKGTRNLVSYDNDLSRGAASPGTDGKDLVWLEGSERVDVNARVYPKVSILTAPYSNDPEVIARTKRVLRSDVAHPPSLARTVVGCGYSASVAADKTTDKLTHFVVRLSDGAAWKMPLELPGLPWRWTSPIGITCDEYFALTSVGPDFRIVRVPLSGLGTPIPPG